MERFRPRYYISQLLAIAIVATACVPERPTLVPPVEAQLLPAGPNVSVAPFSFPGITSPSFTISADGTLQIEKPDCTKALWKEKLPDADGDGIPDEFDFFPNNADNDQDDIPDGQNSNLGLKMLQPDAEFNMMDNEKEDYSKGDRDGIYTKAEGIFGTDPMKKDTDGDGVDDATEIAFLPSLATNSLCTPNDLPDVVSGIKNNDLIPKGFVIRDSVKAWPLEYLKGIHGVTQEKFDQVPDYGYNQKPDSNNPVKVDGFKTQGPLLGSATSPAYNTFRINLSTEGYVDTEGNPVVIDSERFEDTALHESSHVLRNTSVEMDALTEPDNPLYIFKYKVPESDSTLFSLEGTYMFRERARLQSGSMGTVLYWGRIFEEIRAIADAYQMQNGTVINRIDDVTSTYFRPWFSDFYKVFQDTLPNSPPSLGECIGLLRTSYGSQSPTSDLISGMSTQLKQKYGDNFDAEAFNKQMLAVVRTYSVELPSD